MNHSSKQLFPNNGDSNNMESDHAICPKTKNRKERTNKRLTFFILQLYRKFIRNIKGKKSG